VKNQEIFRAAQAPGRWNDPDMVISQFIHKLLPFSITTQIIVGNTELNVEQSKAQMSIWSIWSAPLIMSNDLRTIMPQYREILLNRRVIAIDQDPLGMFGRVVYRVIILFCHIAYSFISAESLKIFRELKAMCS
jgi:hypothetical protein